VSDDNVNFVEKAKKDIMDLLLCARQKSIKLKTIWEQFFTHCFSTKVSNGMVAIETNAYIHIWMDVIVN